MKIQLFLGTLALLPAAVHAQQLGFADVTSQVGLGGINAGRLCLADINADGRPDVIARVVEQGKPDRYRVFLNGAKDVGTIEFKEVAAPNLPTPQAGDCLVFADIDNDGHADAVFTRYLDINNEKFAEPADPKGTCWIKGNGDGTFATPQLIDAASRATTACIAVGDIDRDGLLDLYLGNWYTKYGESNEAFANDLLCQRWEHWQELADQVPGKGEPASGRGRLATNAVVWVPYPKPEDSQTFDEVSDTGGRPTYGAMFTTLGLLELNYGRRANRVWGRDLVNRPAIPQWRGPMLDPKYLPLLIDVAPTLGLDGDSNRSGKYPDWLKERAKNDKRFEREDEKPYRSHGNTFDASVNDIDNDGDFDLFFSEITHAWAGDSSDRSRFLVNSNGSFAYDPRRCVDRVPSDPTIRNWNQGDMFCQLEDFDNDGSVDLLLSSGDYPDNQRLRVFRQQDGGTFFDATPWSGLNNEGSGQISVGDLDLDGDLDIIVGQSFTRLDATQIAGRTPTMKVYLNETVERRADRVKNQFDLAGVPANSLTLKLTGDPAKGCSRDALGAVVRVTADTDGNPATPPVTMSRQLIGIGGHAGKQMAFQVHVGLGAAMKADKVEVTWPDRTASTTTLTDIPAGGREVRQ